MRESVPWSEDSRAPRTTLPADSAITKGARIAPRPSRS